MKQKFILFSPWFLKSPGSVRRIWGSADSGSEDVSTHRPQSSSFWGFVEFYKGIPKRNYFGVYGYRESRSSDSDFEIWGLGVV